MVAESAVPAISPAIPMLARIDLMLSLSITNHLLLLAFCGSGIYFNGQMAGVKLLIAICPATVLKYLMLYSE